MCAIITRDGRHGTGLSRSDKSLLRFSRLALIGLRTRRSACARVALLHLRIRGAGGKGEAIVRRLDGRARKFARGDLREGHSVDTDLLRFAELKGIGAVFKRRF